MDTMIFNPNAGTFVRQGLTAENLIERLRDRGVEACCPQLATNEETIEMAARESGRLIVAGGDGTVHNVLTAAGTCGAIRIAIIPGGTANNFATSLGIPRDIDGALDVVAADHSRKIDLGKVNDVVFSQAAGAGLHARIFHLYGERLDKSKKDAVSIVMRTWTDWESRLMRVVIDGEVYEEEMTQVTAANTPYYGSVFNVAPNARTDDGLLDVVMLGRLSKVELIEYGVAAIIGALEEMPKAITMQARRIEISSITGKPVEVHADAKPVGFTPALVEVLPGCLEVVAPEEEPPCL